MSEYSREKAVVQLLRERSPRTTQELADYLGISLPTVRRLLTRLSQAGVVGRFRGGAYLRRDGLGVEPGLGEREVKQQREKSAIGRAAAATVERGEAIVIDIGSTALAVARALEKRSDIVVFTASLPVVNALLGSNLPVYLTGGRINHQERCLTGSVAQWNAGTRHYDHYFMGVAGIDPAVGYTDFGVEDAELKRVFMKQSRRITVVADHTKFGRVTLTTLGSLDAVDAVITDWQTDPQYIDALRRAGVEVHQVEPPD